MELPIEFINKWPKSNRIIVATEEELTVFENISDDKIEEIINKVLNG